MGWLDKLYPRRPHEDEMAADYIEDVLSSQMPYLTETVHVLPPECAIEDVDLLFLHMFSTFKLSGWGGLGKSRTPVPGPYGIPHTPFSRTQEISPPGLWGANALAMGVLAGKVVVPGWSVAKIRELAGQDLIDRVELENWYVYMAQCEKRLQHHKALLAWAYPGLKRLHIAGDMLDVLGLEGRHRLYTGDYEKAKVPAREAERLLLWIGFPRRCPAVR